MKMSPRVIASLGILLSTAIWGSTFIVTKNSLNALNPFVLLAARFGIATIGMAIILLYKKVKLFDQWKRGFLLGCIIWISFSLQTVGLVYTSASNSGFISATFIIFISFLSFFVFGKKPNPNQIVASLVALVGAWFLTGGISKMNFGDILSFINAFLFAFYILFADKLLKDNGDPLILNFQQFLVVTILSIITIVIFRLPITIGDQQTWISVIYLAIIATIVATGIQFSAQKKLSPFVTSILLSTESVFAALLAWVFGHESLGFSQILGGTIIFMAAVVSQIPDKKVE